MFLPKFIDAEAKFGFDKCLLPLKPEKRCYDKSW